MGALLDTVEENIAIMKVHEETGGTMDKLQLAQSITAVSQPTKEGFLGTAWTVLMDLTGRKATYWSRRHFDKPFRFEITN